MIFAIKPFEIHDGDGIRTTVFFKGCPLRCKWCHNPESLHTAKEMLYASALCRHCGKCTSLCDANILQNQKHIFLKESCTLCGKCEDICPAKAFEAAGMDLSAEEIAAEVLRDALFLKNSGGGVTFSGGEPLMQADLCIETAKILKENGINIAIDTSGYAKREVLERLLPYTDTFLFDIKAIDEEVHLACTGVSNKLILDNINYVDAMHIPMEIRYPYVPTMNDNQAEKIAAFVKELKNVKHFRILPYHSYAEDKYKSLGLPFAAFPVPDKHALRAVLEKMRACGVPNAECFTQL